MMAATNPQTVTIAGSAELRRHYQAVRLRLRVGTTPPDNPRRFIVIREQSHRPDVELSRASDKLPLIRIDPDTPKRVRDILELRSETFDEGEPDMDHWRDIINEVCAKHGLQKPELLGARRANKIAAARHEAMYRMSRETTMSLTRIGRRMGGRDHTTVLYGIRKYEASLRGEAYVKDRNTKGQQG